MVPFFIVTVIYVLHYAGRIKKDPSKSYTYGIKLEIDHASADQLPEFERKHIPVAVVVCLSIGYMIWTAIYWRGKGNGQHGDSAGVCLCDLWDSE